MADWDRLETEGETGRWFDRFERFRAAGPGRTLLGALHGEEADRGGERRSARLPGAWDRAAAKWRWRERAAAWDAEQARLAREAEAGELEARRRSWLERGRELQEKAADRLERMNAEEISPRDMLAMMEAGVKLERLALGLAEEQQKPKEPMSDDERVAAVLAIFARYGLAPAHPPAGP